MSKVTVGEYAQHRKVTERTVRQYIAHGLLNDAVSREGRRVFIDQQKADRAMSRNATTRRELEGKVLPSRPTKAQQAKTAKQAGTAGLSFHDARTLAQRYKAALLKIELDERTGRLVDAEQVRASAFAKARAVRDSLLNIPDRIAPILAAEGDAGKVAEIITREIRQAMEELSK